MDTYLEWLNYEVEQAWKQLEEDKHMFGNGHPITKESRAKWCTLDDVKTRYEEYKKTTK
jgi:hypothetical protein